MVVRTVAFTERGLSWSEQIGITIERPQSVLAWTAEVFPISDAILFICAVGIAVRAIAPHIRNKTTDPAVLVMDEAGKCIIPILSGHIGGANELALSLAERIGATPVITTATDLHGIPAIDVWAVKQDCALENPAAIKSVSATALAGRQVGVMITERELVPPFPATLTLRPRTLVIGAGCKRGTAPDYFDECVSEFLRANGVSMLSVRALASVDRKSDERAFSSFAAKYRVPFLTYSPAQLRAVEGEFAHSDYVERTIGVGNVCERAAMLAGLPRSRRLLVGKTKFAGVTLALVGDENI